MSFIILFTIYCTLLPYDTYIVYKKYNIKFLLLCIKISKEFDISNKPDTCVLETSMTGVRTVYMRIVTHTLILGTHSEAVFHHV